MDAFKSPEHENNESLNERGATRGQMPQPKYPNVAQPEPHHNNQTLIVILLLIRCWSADPSELPGGTLCSSCV